MSPALYTSETSVISRLLGDGSLQQDVEQGLDNLQSSQRLAPAHRDRRDAIPQSSDSPSDAGGCVGVAAQANRRLHHLLVGTSVLRPARRTQGRDDIAAAIAFRRVVRPY